MSFNIPLNMINSEAAIVGVVTLVRFLTQASGNMEIALREIEVGNKNPSISDIKEAFYVHLYKKLLLKEANDIRKPRTKKKIPYGQELDFVLDAISRIILTICNPTASRSLTNKNLTDSEILGVAVRNLDSECIIKYFYATYLSSVYAFYLSKKFDSSLNINDDFKNVVIHYFYTNKRARHCQGIIFHYLYQLKLDKEIFNTINEELIVREVKKLIRKLNKMNFGVKLNHRYRPLTRHVLCGSAIDNKDFLRQLPNGGIEGKIIKLDVDKQVGNIKLRVDKIEQTLGKKLSSESRDLLEIAGYVYVADTQVSRGLRWRRSIHFIIPVRCIRIWKSMASFLSYSLSFLSGDSILFEFCEYEKNEDTEKKVRNKGNALDVDSICLFSGGADSFAATLMAIRDTSRPIILSHFAQNSIANVQGNIIDSLSKYYKKEIKYLRINIVKKVKEIDKESKNKLSSKIENTQRTRSFLYFSLAAIIAAELGLKEISIRENGIQSFNLPVTPAFASTRCGRPTHPRNIFNFNQIINQLYKKKFLIHNDYALKTKSQLIRDAVKTKREEDLLNKTTSCPRFAFGISFDNRRKNRRCVYNCGACYSCILRLVSMSGAGINPDYNKYILNPLLQFYDLKNSECEMLVRFLSFCYEIKHSSKIELVAKYPELCLPRHYFPDIKNIDIINSAINMHKRFANESLSWIQREGDTKIKKILGVSQDTPGLKIDVHCHIDQYSDPFYILSKAKYENIKIVSVANNLNSTRAIFNLANYFDSIIPCAGLHPNNAREFYKDLDSIFKYMDNTQFIGEIGLDYSNQYNSKNRYIQREVFTKILEYCRGKNKILNIHSLNSGKEVLDKLEEFNSTRVILHWFMGPQELFSRVIKNHFYVSVNRSIEYSPKTKNLVASLPKELILTESDGPTEYRKHKLAPFDITNTLLEIAKIWKIPIEKVRTQINKNFNELINK